MKNIHYKITLIFLFSITFSFGQIINNDCSALTATWTFNSVEQRINTWRLDDENDYVISETFGAYENLELVSSLRANGVGTIANCTIEISDDGGLTWNAGSYTVNSVNNNNTNYTYNIGTLSGTNNKIRWRRSSGTKRLQINNIKLTNNVPTEPEIDIEKNSGGSIQNGSTASTGYNTIFAATIMGNSTAPKTYHVSNEGTSNLSLISITSSNPTEFSISLNPGATSITSGNQEDFEITFSPSGIGTRTATITIISDDTDENPYTFSIQGTGECASGTLTLSPDNGPVGTITNVTSTTSNFGSSTTATVNGTSATVTIISTSELEITIPTGATTGSIEITDDLGCKSSQLFTVQNQLISSCEGGTTIPSDLFISEITDHGSGSHTYVEIYNGTGADVDLTNYEIRIHNNGNSSPTHSISLSGTIIDNDVFVFAFGSSNATDNNSTHGYDQSSGVSGVNNNDNIRLYKSNTWIDLWGDTSGTVFTISSKDYTYRRKNTGITAPSTTWSDSDWDSFTPVDYTDIGTYDFSTGFTPIINSITSTATACNESTISVSASEGYIGGKTLQYVWYAYNPDASGLGWQTLTNGGIYTTSSSSPDLIISDVSSVLEYQFYCEVREDDASCYESSSATKVFLSGATWSGANWIWDDGTTINTIPTLGTNVIINGDYDTSTGGAETSFEACKCTINALNTLTIENNTYVKVENNLTVNGNIVIKTDGAFVQIDDSAIVDGDVLTDKSKIKVEKETSNLDSSAEYTYWSAPVFGEVISDGLAEANSNRIYWFNGQNFLDATKEANNDNTSLTGQDDVDDDNNDWQSATTNTIMSPGVGYTATHNTSSSFPGQFTYTFEGPFNNGIYNIPIYRNDSETNDNNWNLIGNPYPSALDVDLFLATNTNVDQNIGGTNGAIYLWSQITPASENVNGNYDYNYAQSDYAIINGTGQTMGGDGIKPTRHIPSGQGFFVSMDNIATSTVVSGNIKTTNVIFNNSMRTTGNNSQFFRTSTTNKANKLWLNLTTDNGVKNQILIAYLDNATNDDDGTYYDAKRNTNEAINAVIYSFIPTSPERKYIIQAKHSSSLSLAEVIPFGFKTTIEDPTIFTLSISELEGEFMNKNTAYLHDKYLDVVQDISTSNYSFSSENGIFDDRFEILFTPITLSINDNIITPNDITIIELKNGEVKFSTSKNITIKTVEILDMLGRRIYNLKGNTSSEVFNLSRLSQAPYVAQVTLSNGQTIKKKAIKKY